MIFKTIQLNFGLNNALLRRIGVLRMKKIKIVLGVIFILYKLEILLLGKRLIKKFNKSKNKIQDKLDSINSFYYVTEYSLDLCLKYMQNDNVYDVFSYTWEKR